MNDLKNLVNKIKHLQIQGANAIAKASLNFLKKYNHQLTSPTKKLFVAEFKNTLSQLSDSRPTEPLNQNLLKFLNQQLLLNQKSEISKLKTVINGFIIYLQKLEDANQIKIVQHGQRLIKNNLNIFTHCHSSTVEQILIKAKKNGKKFKVFNTETRPLFQGRITAKKLLKAKISATMVTDSAASFLISKDSGEELMMDVALLGADGILPDGSAVNKIGSYGIGLSCYYTKVPLYIAGSLLKYDADGFIPLEIRQAEEIWPGKPPGLKIINLTFDKIPANFITGLITEFGLIKPAQVKNTVKKHYPWLTTSF